jgi:hypothetical protein
VPRIYSGQALVPYARTAYNAPEQFHTHYREANLLPLLNVVAVRNQRAHYHANDTPEAFAIQA